MFYCYQILCFSLSNYLNAYKQFLFILTVALWNALLKWLLFWRVAVNTFKVLCVYDMMLVLLKWNGKMLVKWLSDQFWRHCSCIYVLTETADTEITLSVYVNKTARLLHSYRDAQNMQDSYLNILLRLNIYRY